MFWESAPERKRPSRPRTGNRLVFRDPLKPTGKPFAAWLSDLQDQSGVYVIRSDAGPVLYVGESHTGRLYKTLTRHFQSWDDPTQVRFTYDPAKVTVAVKTSDGEPDWIRRLQNKLIARLKPKDNILDVPTEPADEPF